MYYELRGEIMIETGNRVRVTDWGHGYPTCARWFKTHEHEIEFDWAIRYAYGSSGKFHKCRYADDTAYSVLFIKDGKALITAGEFNDDDVYLIDVGALELYGQPIEMTISEIEEKLGIQNLKIVNEKEDK